MYIYSLVMQRKKLKVSKVEIKPTTKTNLSYQTCNKIFTKNIWSTYTFVGTNLNKIDDFSIIVSNILI